MSASPIIARWRIGAALKKDRYSWMRRGQDIKTGKIVTLKFIEKANASFTKEQATKLKTEIEALKNIKHQNVMKLYTYNLNTQYPFDTNADTTSDGQTYIDTVLLVSEYAPGGELFDILYYTSALKETVVRTYLRQ
eukprot:184405_1